MRALDTSFPKGVAFQDWLSNVGALSGGKLSINEPRDDVGPVNLDAGTRWVYGPNPNNGIDADHHPAPHLQHAHLPAAAAGRRRRACSAAGWCSATST